MKPISKTDLARDLHSLYIDLNRSMTTLRRIAREHGIDLDLGLVKDGLNQPEHPAATSSKVRPRKRQ
jgi:hypothetical protein